MRYPKIRELKEALTALIRGPYTNRYPFEPHEPSDQFRGRPYFHEDDCVGCGACAQVCPTGAIVTEDTAGRDTEACRKLTVQWDVCIFCGNCQLNCLTGKGIILSREFAFAVTQDRESLRHSVEKELVLCECCRDPIVPVDQYLWVARKLGALCFSNPSLITFYMRLLNVTAPARARSEIRPGFTRADRLKVLCPRCRREAVLQS